MLGHVPFSHASSVKGMSGSSMSSISSISSSMIRAALLSLALAAVCHAILPEIVNSGISHILEESLARAQSEQDNVLVEVEPKPSLESSHQTHNLSANDLPSSDHNQSATNDINHIEPITNRTPQETSISTAVQPEDLGNYIDRGCSSHDDCGKGKYCLNQTVNSKCLSCKTTDMLCVKDEECCDEQLCVWGQCTQNATKGEAGNTCHLQTDCNPELCCALHPALRFPVCSAKPIEREHCFGGSNHLMALLYSDTKNEGPRKHCPCAGNLRCKHLGRGSMCLKGEDSSEEQLADTLYSEIDYII
ncbi:dickkopf-related protein 3a [Gouania willdenowi]|uniref:dickkopf-related protein 3a n=1 Tax=Gouania willdenowi TaxID=441366 RepID=UPI001056315A|nr:dickkopf-related protein 3 [Gouania willdenowi]